MTIILDTIVILKYKAGWIYIYASKKNSKPFTGFVRKPANWLVDF